jgi:hypothetical protein
MMRRLYTREQVYRAIRKQLVKYSSIREYDAVRSLLFDLMDEKFISNTYFDYLTDLLAEEYITEETFDDAFDAMYLYYGDLIEQFMKENEDEWY